MKAMKMAKAMKAMKVMKVMKKKVTGSRASVMSGKKLKTKTGLTKDKLMKSKTGKIVTKKSNAAGKKAYKNISAWTKATQAARKALGIKGFCPIGGKTAKGQAFLKKAKSLYKK